MKCEDIENLLLAMVDGGASREERERADAHLATCGVCAGRLREMRATWAALDNLSAIEPSVGFNAQIRARLAEEAARPRLLGWFTPRMRVAVAALAAVVVIAWFSVRPPAVRHAQPAQPQDDFVVVKNLPVLENYDVVSNFDALTVLPGAQAAVPQQMD